MKTQKFGIEIEMTGLTREHAAQVVADYLNGTFSYQGGTYDAYHVTDSQDRTWKFIRDSSIQCRKKSNGHLINAGKSYSIELVSPILTYADIPVLQEVIRQLRHAGAVSSAALSCGIHIHINAEPHTPRTLRNLVNLMASKEDLIYKSLQIDYFRECNYCKKINEEMIAIINYKKPQTMDEFSDIWYGTNPDYSHERSAHYHKSRYHSLNLHSTFTKGTIEFRLFNGTTHAGEIRSYIMFCLAVSNQALIQNRVSSKRTVTDNEKYTFRCWLLRLGLIGDEFKNCREHLMKHLSGDAAWRDANRRRGIA